MPSDMCYVLATDVVPVETEKIAKRNANVRYILKNAVLPGLVLGAAAIIVIAITSRNEKDDVSE